MHDDTDARLLNDAQTWCRHLVLFIKKLELDSTILEMEQLSRKWELLAPSRNVKNKKRLQTTVSNGEWLGGRK